MRDILKPIPTHDPTSLVLPIEPLDALKTRLKLGTIAPYEELWETQPDVVRHIQTALGISLKGQVQKRSTIVWDDENDIGEQFVDYVEILSLKLSYHQGV